MKALTIWQPYAGLIVAGVKPVENRTWAPPCKPGTRIAIHAGSKHDTRMSPHGAILGVVTLYEVRRAPRGKDLWWVGPVGWYFRDPVAIEPVPCKGAQGLWNLPSDVDAAVSRAVSYALSVAPKHARKRA